YVEPRGSHGAPPRKPHGGTNDLQSRNEPANRGNDSSLRRNLLAARRAIRLLQSRLQDPRRSRSPSLGKVLLQLSARRNLLAARHDARVGRYRSRTREVRGAEVQRLW